MDQVYRNQLGAIFQDARRRQPFDIGLQKLFPACEQRPSARIEQLLEQLAKSELQVAEDN
jgi:hypothetical protein